jgi:hypothetical protein
VKFFLCRALQRRIAIRRDRRPLTLDLRRAPEAWMEGPPGIASEQAQQ